MKKFVAVGVVVVVGVVAAVLAERPGEPPAAPAVPKLEPLLVQCDAGGSSLARMYDTVSEPAHRFVTSDPARALTAVRGQIANVIAGRLAACERALAVAQHDKRGSAVTALVPFVERLRLANATLAQLTAALQSGSDASATITALDAAMH
jgi:hypothetical protein